MCGIAGIFCVDNGCNPLEFIQGMTDSIRHRGPDDEGFAFFTSAGQRVWSYGGRDTPGNVYDADLTYTPMKEFSGQQHEDVLLALGHRRLSIIDLSPAGHQPMCTVDGRYWIVYNGEIYNYLELREELVRAGYSFQSRSDTEVLLNAYAHWGVDALKRLIGMFAFAIYDRQDEALFLARDFFGIKPLYYTIWPHGFALASEIKALLALPHVSRTVNPQRVYEYLRLGFTDHGGETLIGEIQQLPAAHYLCLTLEKNAVPRPVRYWDIDLTVKSNLSFEEAANTVRDMFLKNIALHLRSDVPVGAALSGGIDSSAIVLTMRTVQGDSLDLRTFSFIADDPHTSEEKWVDMIGKKAGASVCKVRLTQEELLSDLDQLIYFQDEPFGGTSIYAQYRVMQLAKENGIKVLLDGQGADEMLGGYRPYLDARLASLLRQFLWLKAWRFLLSLRQYEDYGLKTILMRAGSFFLPPALRRQGLKLVGMDLIPPWLKERWFRDREVTIAPSERIRNHDILRGELYRSLMQDKLIALLRHEDRNSMAFSIESRVPFLTPEFATFLSSLPEEYIIDPEGMSKSVFRRAMEGIVPREILARKDKIGFATPELFWLRHLSPWIESTLASDAAKRLVFLDIDAFQKRYRDVMWGRKPFDLVIWRYINFIVWVKQCGISC